MAISPILADNKIQEFESYHTSYHKYETIKKIITISAIIFGLVAVGSIASIFALNITSDLLIGSAVLSGVGTTTLLICKKTMSYFQSRLQQPSKITPEEFLKTINQYNSKFKKLDAKKYLGKIEKIDLGKDSKLFLKADLHGDFYSLIKYIKTLQKQGILDQNYKISKEYKSKVVIAFLGDYLDRGKYSFEVLDFLMKLKINNPEEFVLLRGNHEDTRTSIFYIHPQERHFYNTPTLIQKLEAFYTTLPLCVFIGAKDESNQYQYTCLTHGALDPDIDVNEVLDCRAKRAEMFIKKDKKATLSKRILKLLPNHLVGKNLTEITPSIKALNDFILNQSEDNLQKAKNELKIKNLDKKRAKQILSILKVQDVLIQYSVLIEDERKDGYTSFNWGDITKNCIKKSARGNGLCLSADFIKDYFRVVSIDNRKVKVLRAGHAHCHKEFSYKDKKGFIEILPVAGELEGYDSYRSAKDISEMVTIFPKVKQWQKQMLTRKRSEEDTQISNLKPFYQPA